MKRILSVFLSVLFLLTTLPLGAISVAAATSGATGACRWSLSGTHLTISGNGAMRDYDDWEWGPWGKVITSVTIETGVTTIGERAFANCYSLESVTIPDSVTTIGERAFSHCYSLESVTIPGNVTTIGDYAFSDCTSLTSVTIPDSVTTIGRYAFSYCDSLTCITVDADNPNYSSLDGVLFDKRQTTLMRCPGGKTGAYTIPDSVTTIGYDAFSHCDSLTTVTIGDSVASIGYQAFFYCDSLTSVTIGDSVTTIGDEAFYHCDSLTTVTIGDSVTAIGDDAFYSCTSLESVHYHGCEEERAAIAIGSYNSDLTYATWHYYDNAYDAECNACGKWRSVPAHVYDNACDGICNVCGAIREVGDHIYDHPYDPDCNVCGAVRVVNIVYGDADGDSRVTTRDVALLQQYIAGWDVTPDVAADADNDGRVTTRDVALLQQYIAGWDVELG